MTNGRDELLKIYLSRAAKIHEICRMHPIELSVHNASINANA